MTTNHEKKFFETEILPAEHEAINKRRGPLGRDDVKPRAGKLSDKKGLPVYDTVGLALSGGGIRSAAVSLGVLQGLNHHDALRNVDYLSTVSGGGYIGSSLTATMTRTNGDFVFGNPPKRRAGAHPLAAEIRDTEAVGHLRNYSNYLIPRGARDVLTGAAIVVRGLVANFGLVFPVVLLLAALTIWSTPSRSSLYKANIFGYGLDNNIFGLDLAKYLPVENFGVTLLVALFGFALFFLWALYRSFLPPTKLSEFRKRLPSWGAAYLVILGVTMFCELQPFVVAGMFDIADRGGTLAFVTGLIQKLAAVATPVAAVVTFFRHQFGEILKSASATSKLSTRILAALSKVAIWVAGSALLLLIWVSYLYLCYWGIINNTPKIDPAQPGHSGVISGKIQIEVKDQTCPGPISGNMQIDVQGLSSRCPIEDKIQVGGKVLSCRKVISEQPLDIRDGCHTPGWLLTSSERIAENVFRPAFEQLKAAGLLSDKRIGFILERPMALFYCFVGVILLVLSWLLRPNANSLHRLYRDRLSKAFLFDSKKKLQKQSVEGNVASPDPGQDFKPLDTIRLSELSPVHAPYHLINAALNIQGSDYANRRGRNADFFLFSPRYVGSLATGYAPTPAFEKLAQDLDLATAMAISGAAVSSNMGRNSIRPFTPTLALLNVRLGYWLKNPRQISPDGSSRWSRLLQSLKHLSRIMRHQSIMFLWSEITGRLYENTDEIYLTDGGHIENLGIYELLRRRCRIIVLVDAEADAEMHFTSFIALQRYARIDLGVRIAMPWDDIRTSTLAWMGAASPEKQRQLKASKGPHAAIGVIDYGGGDRGFLLYLKSSLTGDENDYIRDYARRYDDYPHETTGDQFFNEEQFEVYRALGFHIAHGLLSGDDVVEVEGAAEGLNFKNASNKTIKAVREALTA